MGLDDISAAVAAHSYRNVGWMTDEHTLRGTLYRSDLCCSDFCLAGCQLLLP